MSKKWGCNSHALKWIEHYVIIQSHSLPERQSHIDFRVLLVCESQTQIKYQLLSRQGKSFLDQIVLFLQLQHNTSHIRMDLPFFIYKGWKNDMGTTSAKSVHKFSCRYLIYMSTEQEREYTLSVMHVTEFTTQQKTWCKDVWFSRSPWCSGCSFSQGKVGWSHLSPDKTALWKQTDRKDEEQTEEDPRCH